MMVINCDAAMRVSLTLLALLLPLVYIANAFTDFDSGENDANDKGGNKVLHRHRRETNSTSGGAFFDDPNNAAMYLVLPLMVFVYGGCACIYCCYRCREYMEEKQPFTMIKLKIQGKSFNEIINRNKLQEPKDQEMFSDSSERPSSVKSLPERTRTFDYINYTEGQRSALSSPGVGYVEDLSKDDTYHPFTIPASTSLQMQSPSLSDDTERRDSGIQDDRDCDIEKLYASSLSRCQSNKSFYSGSIQSELTIEEYMHTTEDDSNPGAWLGINEVGHSNIPPEAVQYIPPIKNVVKTDSPMQTDDPVKKNTLQKSESVNPHIVPLNFPNLISVQSTSNQDGGLRQHPLKYNGPFSTFDGYTPNKQSRIKNSKAKVNAVIELSKGSKVQRKENITIKKDVLITTANKKEKLESEPQNERTKLTNENTTDATAESKYNNDNFKNKPRKGESSNRLQSNAKPSTAGSSMQRKIDYLDNAPQINGRYRMYYQNKRLSETSLSGNQSDTAGKPKSVPIVPSAISEQTGSRKLQLLNEDKQAKPIYIGISDDGDVNVTGKKSRPKISNVKQLSYPY